MAPTASRSASRRAAARLGTRESVYLALSAGDRDVGHAVPAVVLERVQDRFVLGLADGRALWHAAGAAEEFNRRRAFRVSTLDLLAKPTKQAQETLTTHIEQAGSSLQVELLDLSLTGCGVRIKASRTDDAPALGTRVFLEARGGVLEQSLRLPARVERYQQKGRHLYLGLAFLRSETRLWTQVEQQIGAYLVKRQTQRSGRRAG
ncbi:MAG: PilZ domain-containing protein [Planctomycetota bacterium]